MNEPEIGLRVELAQVRPRKGRVDENLARIREWVSRSAGAADVVVFPEAVLSGYFVEGAVEEVSRSVAEVAEGLGPSGPSFPDVVLGFYERGAGPTHNSVAWFTPEAGRYQVVHRHRKAFLPTYGVFDEARFVSPGRELEAFDTRFGRVGIMVCEEMLHSLVPTLLVLDGAELLVVVAASPVRGFHPGAGVPGNLTRWDIAARAVALEHGVHLGIAHLVGSEGGKIFPGGSAFYLPGGEMGPRGPLFTEGSASATLDRTRVHRHRARSPLLSDLRTRLPHLLDEFAGWVRAEEDGEEEDGPEGPPETKAAGPSNGKHRQREKSLPPERVPAAGLPDPKDGTPLELDLPMVESALVRFLRDEIVDRRGFHDIVLGVSGGVDSAVSLLLAVRALGPDHVHPLFLPYATSNPRSLEDGARVVREAGLRGRIIEITPAVDAYIEGEEPKISDLRRGNVAARVRALILWDQAARLHALPLGTGNKSERLLGYFTWHADDSPPINPLGDLFKTQVWALARHLGVPKEIVEKAPSADLVQGVDDEHEIGVSYAVADRILYWMLEGYRPKDLVRAGFPADSVEKVRKRLEGTHWKRELPTVATLSESAIGEFYLRPVDY
ncbi:MAG: NAD+ synthase [Gemmatimonadota bacterium]